MADRAKRTCHACAQTDDHPRHIMYHAQAHPVTGEILDLSVERHIDCCAAAGCEVCATDLEFAKTARGPALTKVMTAKASAHLAALAERHGIETGGV